MEHLIPSSEQIWSVIVTLIPLVVNHFLRMRENKVLLSAGKPIVFSRELNKVYVTYAHAHEQPVKSDETINTIEAEKKDANS